MIQRRELITSSLGAALLSAFDLAQAQSTKTVRIVVPFAAGRCPLNWARRWGKR
jgi:tripartite-type tricarboxylate transporter receptor subunit TctC